MGRLCHIQDGRRSFWCVWIGLLPTVESHGLNASGEMGFAALQLQAKLIQALSSHEVGQVGKEWMEARFEARCGGWIRIWSKMRWLTNWHVLNVNLWLGRVLGMEGPLIINPIYSHIHLKKQYTVYLLGPNPLQNS